MDTNVANQEVLLDDDLIEKDFNDALESLQKSLKLEKAKDEDEDDEKSYEESDAEEDEDESEEDEKEMEKSISDILAEDPEAAAAMDVEPFLRQLAKAIDESVSQVLQKVIGVEAMVKSQAQVVMQSAKLQKSVEGIVKQIGGQPVRSNSVRGLQKSRFESNGEKIELNNQEVLSKSREWVKNRQINLVDAGTIESRINKNRLGLIGDALDQKVLGLMKEGK
jgi:flagellar biosynthesis GTPase FlhF